jgi:hypothetical protein
MRPASRTSGRCLVRPRAWNPRAFLSREARAEEGFTVHAGADEHSQLFFLRSDLIAPDFDKAPSFTARTFEDHVRIAKVDGWTGYFGAPRFATATIGAQEFRRSSEKLTEIALQILDGLDDRSIPRYADEMDPLNVDGEQKELDYEAGGGETGSRTG